MKGLKKRLVSVMLVGTMLISAAPETSKAAGMEQTEVDGQISVCSEYADEINTALSITNGTAKVTARVRGIPGVTTKIHAKVILQKYSDHSWSAVKTYEESVSTTVYTMSKTKAVSKGKYRVKGVYTVYKGAKSETTTKYSGTVTYS